MKNSTKMSYDEAVTACKEYNFKYNDWTLPSNDQFKNVLDLLEVLLREDINKDIDDDLEEAIWTTDKQKNGQETSLYYTICVREY